MTFQVGTRVVVNDDSKWNGESGVIVRIRRNDLYPYEVQLDRYEKEGLRYWFPREELEEE